VRVRRHGDLRTGLRVRRDGQAPKKYRSCKSYAHYRTLIHEARPTVTASRGNSAGPPPHFRKQRRWEWPRRCGAEYCSWRGPSGLNQLVEKIISGRLAGKQGTSCATEGSKDRKQKWRHYSSSPGTLEKERNSGLRAWRFDFRRASPSSGPASLASYSCRETHVKPSRPLADGGPSGPGSVTLR